MKRYPDWATRLDVFLRENGNRRFKYGEWDCALFACNAINAMTGEDPASEMRGKYTSEKTAIRLARSVVPECSVFNRLAFLRNITEVITAKHRMKEIPLKKARRGDVVLIERAKGHSLGIVALSGQDIATVAGDRIVLVPTCLIRQTSRAWMVGK